MRVSYWEIWLIYIFGGVGHASCVLAFRICKIGKRYCILFVLNKMASR
jgi:hypothetical protein